MTLKRSSMLAAASFYAAQLAIAPADARIRCDGRYQVNPGGTMIATPYCADHYMFEVASGSYGMSTSFDRIRASRAEKERVCKGIGRDSRVSDICQPFMCGCGGS